MNQDQFRVVLTPDVAVDESFNSMFINPDCQFSSASPSPPPPVCSTPELVSFCSGVSDINPRVATLRSKRRRAESGAADPDEVKAKLLRNRLEIREQVLASNKTREEREAEKHKLIVRMAVKQHQMAVEQHQMAVRQEAREIALYEAKLAKLHWQ
uniref:Uncharacterized protein n=1 Tax=Ciona intestinalis TaxID=7719 RepID=F6PWN4_CIOIN